MTLKPAEMQSRVQSAVERLKTHRPAYKEMLAFYGPLFVEQELRAAAMRPFEIDLPTPEMAEMKEREGFPLLSMADFPIDPQGGTDLFHWICDTVQNMEGPLSKAGAALKNAVLDGRLHLPGLFSAILAGDDDQLQETAEAVLADREIVALLAYQSIRPSLLALARSLADKKKGFESWRRGICPVCGSFPVFSLFKEEGRRELVCGFCWHEWPYRRVACPFCQTTDSKKLRYFYDESEPESRVDLCDACRRYLKNVDTRKTDRAIYPPLEVLTTLHLDIKAQDLGFKGELKPRS